MKLHLRTTGLIGLGITIGGLALPAVVWAEETAAAAAPAPAKIDGADTAFMLICSALVMVMTPGLGFFYGGMTRRKNVLATFQQSFIMLGVISLQWVLFGYSLAFGPDHGHVIGGLEWAGLQGVGMTPSEYAPTIPHQLFMVYQLMFAIITPALISGAFAERMKFSAYLLFITPPGRPSSTTPWRTGSGASAAGSRSWVRSTLPVVWSCTSSRASRRSAACW